MLLALRLKLMFPVLMFKEKKQSFFLKAEFTRMTQ